MAMDKQSSAWTVETVNAVEDHVQSQDELPQSISMR